MAADSGQIEIEPGGGSSIPRLTPFRVVHPRAALHDQYVAVTPDGSRIYALHNTQALDAWPLLVHHWPHIGGTLTALAAVVLLVTWLRRRRTMRRTAKDQPHCRRCRYQLTGVASPTCPECGADLSRHRPILGRRFALLPLAAAAVLALCVGVGYSALWLVGEPRIAQAAQWHKSRLPWLHRMTRGRWQHWVDPFACDVMLLLELDASSGAVRRRLALGETLYLPQVSPDGRHITVDVEQTIEVWSVRSGRRAAVHVRSRTPPGRGQVFRTDGVEVFTANAAAGWSVWDLRTGHELRSFPDGLLIDQYWQYPVTPVDRIVPVVRDSCEVYRVDLVTGEWRSCEQPSEQFRPTQDSTIHASMNAPDGRWLYTLRSGVHPWTHRVERWDLHHARYEGWAVREDQALGEFSTVAVTPDGRHLLLSHDGLDLASLHRVSDGQRVAELDVPQGGGAFCARFCDQGRTAVICTGAMFYWFDLTPWSGPP